MVVVVVVVSLKMLQCSRYQQVFKLNNEYHETVRFWCISFHILLLGWHLWIYTEQIIHSKSVLILCCCTAWWGAGVVVCLQRGADLHMAQLMPLPLTVSCFSKIQIGFTFWYRLSRVVLNKGPLNVCMCAVRKEYAMVPRNWKSLGQLYSRADWTTSFRSSRWLQQRKER